MAEVEATCNQHGDPIITEAGGGDMPTIHGRRYCPTCQEALMAALDAPYAMPGLGETP